MTFAPALRRPDPDAAPPAPKPAPRTAFQPRSLPGPAPLPKGPDQQKAPQATADKQQPDQAAESKKPDDEADGKGKAKPGKKAGDEAAASHGTDTGHAGAAGGDGKKGKAAKGKAGKFEQLAAAQPVTSTLVSVPEPETDPVMLGREPLRTAESGSGFEAPAAPVFRQQPRAGGKTEAPPREQDHAIALFRDAMAAARRLHDDLVADARRAAAQVESTSENLASRRQNELDRGLGELADGLRATRSDFDRAADDDAALVDRREKQTRVAIARAASSAFGALNGAKAAADAIFSTHDQNKTAAKEKADTAASSVTAAGSAASAAVLALNTNKEKDHPTTVGPLPSAINEAINLHLPERVPPRAKTYSDEGSAEFTSLSATFTAMKTGLDDQFKKIAREMTKTATSSTASIVKARDAALKQLKETAEQLHASIEETRASGHAALVKQHDMSRQQLVAAYRGRARSEGQSAQQRATRGTSAALALATGQQAGARSLADSLAREKMRPAADFAKVVISSAGALIKNIGKSGGDQRMRVKLSSDTGEANALRQADATAAKLAGSASDIVARLSSAGQSSGESLTRQIERSAEGFDKLPEPVTSALRGALPSAKAAYASQNQQAADKVTLAEGTISGAMSGKGGGGGKTADGAAAAPAPAADAAGGEGAKAKEIPDQFVERANKIAGKADTDDGIAELIATSKKEVPTTVRSKASTVHEALVAFSTTVETVMAALRNITALQGAAISDFYQTTYTRNLEQHIRIELWKTFSADSTNEYNINAAINYLHGNHVAAALLEMKAAVNYSNDEGRVERIQRSLTPAELDQLNTDHPEEMKDIIGDLDGTDKKVSTALNRIKPVDPRSPNAAAQEQINLQALGEANAYSLQQDIDRSRKKRGEEGGDATADMIAGKRQSIGSDVLSGGDALGAAFEDPEAAKARKEKLWAATDKSFDQVITTLPDGSPNTPAPGDKHPPGAIARYAAAARSYEEFVPDNSEAGGHYRTVSEGLDPRQTQLIDAIVKHGPDSEDAAAATIAVELNRKSGKPKEDRLRKALGSDLLAAREGESDKVREARMKDVVDKDGKIIRKGDLRLAQERRENILLKYGDLTGSDKLKQNGDGEAGRTKAAGEIKQDIVNTLDNQLSGDPTAKAYTKSMVQNLEPDPVTAFDFALAHEEKNKETLQATAGRLNRDQIDDAVKRWDAKYPQGPPLYKRLGMFEHGSGALEGDARNETEIKFMGVPRDEKERAEVANMASKQQVRDSGAAGRAMAGEEYQRMLNNQAKLLKLMGVTAADIDQYGRIKKTGPDGKPIKANFDKDGRLIVKTEGQRDEFEAAMQMSSLNAEAYKSAVDRVAMGVTMALMVVAAAITTFVTFGGAAAIWGPILVTAGAGLVGIAMTAAIKGDRYTKAEIQRDLVMTFVQAATAGLGAYAGTALRGAGNAAKAAATSEKLVGQIAGIGEKQALSFGAKALNFGKEVVIDSAVGGTTNAINSAAGAAMDPENRRQGKSGEKALDSGFKSFIGGAVGSAITKPIGALAKPLGKLGERVAGNVAGGFTTRLTEARVGQAMGDPHQSWGESIESAKEGIGQDIVQAAAEHGAEHLAEGRATRRAAAAANDTPHPAKAAPQEPVPTAKPAAPVAEPPASSTGVQHSPDAPARAAAVQAALPPDVRPIVEAAVPRAPAIDPAPPRIAEPAPAPAEPRPASHAEEHGAPTKRPAEEHQEPIPHAIEREGEAKPKGLRADNDNGPVHARIALSQTDMVKMGRIAEGTVFAHPDPHNLHAANDNFGRMILGDPTREVAVYHNPVTGEHIVIQGAETMVGAINAEGKLTGPGAREQAYAWQSVLAQQGKGHWVLKTHYHPNRAGELGTHLTRRLPSGAGADFHVVASEVGRTGGKERSSRIYFIDNGHFNFTDFGVNPHSENGKYWLNYPEPGTGVRVRKEFASIADYHGFVGKLTGEPYPLPRGFSEPVIRAIPSHDGVPRALASGSAHQALTPADIADVHAVSQKIAEGNASEAHAMVKQMGLVGEPDSMARLHLALNEGSVPLETRKALSNAVLEATRAHLTEAGILAPGEDLHLLFHGASPERTASLKESGVNRAALQHGPQEDFAGGLYFSRQLENADFYAKRYGPGEIFPLLARGSELGTVVNIEPGGAHRAAWERFTMANTSGYGDKLLIDPTGFDPVTRSMKFGAMDGRGNRGIMFEKFLQSLGGPHATPDVVFGDLGGPFTSGHGTGDQQTIKSERLAALFDAQLGFRRAGTAPEMAEPIPHAIDGANTPAADGSTPATAAKPAAKPEHPSITELNRMLAALATRDPEGPAALIDRIRAGGPQAGEAQRDLNAISKAPQDAHVVNISPTDIEAQLPPPNGKFQERYVTLHGVEMRVYRSAPTTENPAPTARFEATLPPHRKDGKPVVYQFGDGELRVWRSAPTSEHPQGLMKQETVVGPRRDRQGLEDQIFSHGEAELAGSPLERAHLHGAGLGVESPFGIGMAPREVNQIVQNKGIEAYMRRLRDALPPGATLLYETTVAWHERTGRQSRIEYRLDIAFQGERLPFAEFAINIESDPPGTRAKDRRGTRSVTVDPLEWRHPPESPSANRLFEHLHEAVDLPKVLLHGLPRGRPPGFSDVLALLRHTDPRDIEAAAKSSGSRLATHRPPPPDAFDFARWRDGLNDIFSADVRPRYLVIDTRELGLTDAQLRRIEAAIRKLPAKYRDRIVRIP